MLGFCLHCELFAGTLLGIVLAHNAVMDLRPDEWQIALASVRALG